MDRSTQTKLENHQDTLKQVSKSKKTILKKIKIKFLTLFQKNDQM